MCFCGFESGVMMLCSDLFSSSSETASATYQRILNRSHSTEACFKPSAVRTAEVRGSTQEGSQGRVCGQGGRIRWVDERNPFRLVCVCFLCRYVSLGLFFGWVFGFVWVIGLGLLGLFGCLRILPVFL